MAHTFGRASLLAVLVLLGSLGASSAQATCVGGAPNGVPESGEECDDGNTVNGDTCDNNCTTPRCGNMQVVTPETCDDGNTDDRDFCPGDCIADPCTRTDAAVDVTVVASRSDLAAVEAFLDYPEGKIELIGTGTDIPPESASGPGTATFNPNDYDHAIKLVAFDLFSFGQPEIAFLHFNACEGSPPPTPEEFGCTIDVASDENQQPLAGVTCSVTVVAETTTTTVVGTTTTSTSTTSTTIPCVTASCIARNALLDPACAAVTVPTAVTSKLEAAATFAEQAASATGKAQKKLKKKAKRALKAAGKKAKKLSKGSTPQLEPACAAALQSAIAAAQAALNAGQF